MRKSIGAGEKDHVRKSRLRCDATAQNFETSMPRFPDAGADHPQLQHIEGSSSLTSTNPTAQHSNEPQKSFGDSERQFIWFDRLRW